MTEPVLISYRTETIIPRPGILGDMLRAIASRPMMTGFFLGLAGNLAALIRSPKVLETAPLEAAVLGLMVLLVTTVLVSRMGNFFSNLALLDLDVVRAITYDGRLLQWIEGEQILKAIENPTFELVARPLPEDALNDEKALAQPWDVWLKCSTEDSDFIIATRLLASEVVGFPQGVIDAQNIDENLPPHILSPLLLIARFHAKKDSALAQPAQA